MFNIQDVILVRPWTRSWTRWTVRPWTRWTRWTGWLSLWVLTFLIILSGMDVTVAAERFNYADNIGFIKDAAKLRDEFPICDEFLDVEWFHRLHKSYGDEWIGKSRLDVYDGDRKDSKAIMATMFCKGEKCTRATVHLIELEQYFDKKLEEWIRKTDGIRRTYCFYPDECDDARPVGLGILINTNSDDKDYSNDSDLFLSVIAGKTNLWDSYFERRIEPLRGISGIEPLRGDPGRAVLWISTTLIGAVPLKKGNRFAGRLYPNGYPRLSIGHFRKNICILSPTGKEVGIVEPSLPFLSRIFMPDAELKREFGVIYTALSETYPEWFPKDDPGRSDVDEMRGFLRRYVLLDVDGENGPDLVDWYCRYYHFINDPDILVMHSDEYMRPEKYLIKSMVSSAEIKSLQKTVLQEKEKFRLQLKAKKQKDMK